MSKRFIAVFCCILIVTLPLSIAKEDFLDDFDEEDTGESIIVGVKAYEPTVLRSNLLEDDDVDVYAYISGYTLGSFASGEGTKDSPFYADPEIKQVRIRPLDTNTDDLIRNTQYLRPLKFSLGGAADFTSYFEDIAGSSVDKTGLSSYSSGDLGTIVLRLKQIPAEKDMPKELKMNFGAEIYFENAERLFGLLQQDLLIPEDIDEAAWKTKSPEEYGFFSGKGFIRATDIGDNSASFVIYETTGYKEQSSGIFSAIGIAVKKFLQTRSVNLNVGETSDYIRFSEMDFVPNNAFRIKLNSVKNPQDAKARVKISLDGKTQSLVLYEGMPLYKGSSYRVVEISESTKLKETIQTIKIVGLSQYLATKTFTSLNYEPLVKKTYTGETRRLEPFALKDALEIQLENSFGDKTIVFDTSMVPSVTTLTNSYDLTKGITLEQVLNGILPSGYEAVEELGKITIKPSSDVNIIDPCEGKAMVVSDELDVDSMDRRNVICTIINEYKTLSREYGTQQSPNGVTYADEANFKIAKLYAELTIWLTDADQLLAGEKAKEYLKRVLYVPRFQTDAQVILSQVQRNIDQKSAYKPAIFEDNGREVVLTLTEIIKTPEKLKPHVIIQVEGSSVEKRAYIGDTIIDEEDAYWVIKKVTESEVTLEKVARVGVVAKAGKETLRIKNPESVAGKTLLLKEINLNKQAHVSIIPGTGDALVSRTNFTLTIPIEKRLIQLSPENINSQLNQTEKWIGELDKIINKLESVVKTWNTVCLGTFAYLTIKNSFFLGFARSQARTKTLYGPDGNSGWSQYCASASGSSQTYDSVDECMRSNANMIERQIDETQEINDKLDDEMKDYQNTPWYNELMQDYEEYGTYGSYLGEEEFFTQNGLRQYRYQQLLKETDSYQNLNGQETYNLQADVDKNLISFDDANKKQKEAYNSAVEAMKKSDYSDLGIDDKQRAFNDVYQGNVRQDDSSTVTGGEDFRELNGATVTLLPLLRKDVGGSAFIYTQNGKTTVSQAEVRHYLTKLKTLKEATTDDDSEGRYQAEIDRMNSKYDNVNNKNLNAPLTTNYGSVYVDNAGKFYTSARTYDLTQLNEEYKGGPVPYPDGKPHCIPTGDGNFVKVLDFFNDGSPKTVQEWNIGDDGYLCTNDDIPLKHETLLNLPENERDQRDLRSSAARAGKLEPGEILSIGGKDFPVGQPTTGLQSQEPSCYEVMDPDDCATLFGVCDPVMCPSSRFNLGGSYQVDNVVQSGIIGSLVLGLHNFNAKEPVPICLTGVLAGLKNIRSVLTGYTQCLKEAQATGRSVGICDQLRSIFICDLVYREAVNLFNAKGGIINWIAKKAFGDGGGEYLNFQSSLQNVQKSVSFFTQQYSKTAFAAYRGRSTEDLGKTICSVAIYGKLPQLGEMMDQLTNPESPPQFTAKLTVSPHTESARIQKEAYNIFYHIYAGEDKDADYTVFLRNSIGDTYYATESCGERRSTIVAGGISSQSLDCVADAGFNEVCITINGVTECGFGKVTSSFSLNYMNDLIVEDEASKQITKEEDCMPDNQRYGSPISNFIAGSTGQTSGITRVCSIGNPGQGTNVNDWKVIGTCGKDLTGRNIGSCWIDLRTVAIKDIERMEKTQLAIQEAGLNATRAAQGISNLLSKEAAQIELDRIKALPDDNFEDVVRIITAYHALEERSLSITIAAQARYQSGQAHELLITHSKIFLPTLIKTTKSQVVTAPKKVVDSDIVRTLQKKCSECDSDLLGACSAKECHKLNINCFFFEESLTNDVCKACPDATKCSDFNADEKQCGENTRKCSEQADLDCAWGTIGDKEGCWDKGRLSTVPFEEIKAVCDSCNEGFFDTCSIDECHLISQNNCVFEDAFLWAGGGNKCLVCGGADSCEYFEDDEEQCNNFECTQQSELSCGWGEFEGDEGCWDKNQLSGSADLTPKSVYPGDVELTGDIVDIPKIDKVTCAASDCRLDETLIPVLKEAASKLGNDEVLRINGAYRSLEKQRQLFINQWLSDPDGAMVCGPRSRVERKPESATSDIVQNLDNYRTCPHVHGSALDLNLLVDGKKDEAKLLQVMCSAGWVNYDAEPWHFEYGAELWWGKTKDKDPAACQHS